jgi:Uma2 family endonuclease
MRRKTMSTTSNPVMETPATPVVPANSPVAPPTPPIRARLPVLIDEEALIPDWVVDHESFRRWATSDDLPRRGWFSFIDGTIWVERTMEDFFSHNQVKSKYNTTLGAVVDTAQSGYYVPDRSLWTNVEFGVSTETDAMFFTYEALKSGRIRLIERVKRGYKEIEGTPDAVLEIVSDSSVKKDTVVLKEKCEKAGVREYWLVDARGDEAVFQLWRSVSGRYQPAPNDQGWLTSEVFAKAFKLIQGKDPLGHPQFQLLVR